jgi:undecaprenyl-diphosphatase
MNFADAVLLGIVEGLTEFLPVSSTGHLLLSAEVLAVPQTDFVKSFEIAIQLGAILAVVVLYARTLLVDLEVLKRVAVAFLPTAVIGMLAYGFLRDVLFEDNLIVVAALVAGGLFMIGFELFYRAPPQPVDLSTLSFRKAFLIGALQTIAIVPGVSRAAATILAGLAMGMDRRAIVEFSFLLAVPTMAAATGYDLLHTSSGFTLREAATLATGFAVSFVTGVIGIRFLLGYIQRRSFIAFGIYRVVLGAAFFLVVL